MISRNLNTEPKTLEKIEKNKSTTFGLLCCETGPISLDYSLNKTGFVCGEKALLNIKVNKVVTFMESWSRCVKVDNASGKEVKEIRVNFLQTLKFHGVYKPPKPKPKRQKPGKQAKQKKKSLLKRKTAKVRPAREPTAIKKTKAIKMINDDIDFKRKYSFD